MSLFRGMFIMSDEDYSEVYWPKLANLIDLLFEQSDDFVKSAVSYEEMYSCVYKCVCSARGLQLKEDLLAAVQGQVSKLCNRVMETQQSHKDYVAACNRAFATFNQASCTLVAVFQYMNRVMLSNNQDDTLHSLFKQIFIQNFVQHHLHKLIGVLCEAVQKPFLVQPDDLQSCVQLLHSADPDCVAASPQLFARFLPGVLPPAQPQALAAYAEEERRLQRDLLCHPAFIAGDRGRKRQGSPSNDCGPPRRLLHSNTAAAAAADDDDDADADAEPMYDACQS